jgi:hypothetical protein
LKLKILKSIISPILLLLFVFNGYSQEQRTYGLRIGFDLSRLPLYYLDPKIKGLELSFDFETLKNLYPVFELGSGKLKLEKENFRYSSNGSYLRIGFDYNIFEPYARNQYEMAFVGIRYAFSSLRYGADNIFIQDGYWGDFSANLPERKMHANWVEIAGGLRVELFHNLFAGWSLRARFMIYKTKDVNMNPFNIPGYGKGSLKSALGFNYSIYYRIPVFRKKIVGSL